MITYKLTKSKYYQNLVLELDGDVLSEHFDKNQENQIAGIHSECILCGKGIKSTNNHYTMMGTGGTYHNLIHKDDMDLAEKNQNQDGGFMGCWDVGSECFKRLKHIPEIKNYVLKPKKENQ